MRQTERYREQALAAGIAGIGGLALVGSVAALLQAAWRQGLVGPAHAVGASLALGAGGLLAAEALWIGRWRPVSLALSGASLGIVSLSLFVANAWYGWINAPVTVGLLAGAAALGALLATRRDSQLFACLALITAGTAPGLLWAGVGASLGLAVVALADVAATIAVVRRGWRALAVASVLGSVAVWITVAVAGSGEPALAVASAAVAGCAFGLGALRAERGVGPLGIGAVIAALVGLAWTPATPVGGLVVASLVGGGLQLVSLRSGRAPLASGIGIAVAIVTGVVLASLLTMASPPRATILLLSVFSLPFLCSWGAGVALGRPADSTYQGQLVLHAVCSGSAQVCLASTEPHAWYAPLVAGSLLGMGGLAGVGWRRGEGPVVQPEASGLVPASILAASLVLLLPWGSPWLRLLLGLVLLGSSLLGPVTPIADPRPELRWSPLLIAVAPAAALLAAWGQAVGFAWGVPVLAASGLAAVGLLGADRLEPGEAQRARRLYRALAVGLAILAVPAQIQGAGWTVGWALIVLGLAVLERRRALPSLRWVSGVLAAGVALRLIAVPGLLSHEGVLEPSPWIWLPYVGSSGLLLLAAALHPDRRASGWSVDAATGIGFALLNVQLSHVVAGGWMLTGAPVAARTALWAAFALGLMVLSARPAPRRAGLVVLALVAAKVVARDLWLVDGIARAGLLLGVAACFLISAALLYRSEPEEDERSTTGPTLEPVERLPGRIA